MLGFHRHTIDRLEHATSVLFARIQRLEEEQAALLARLERGRQLQSLTAHIAAAGRAGPVIGAAMGAIRPSHACTFVPSAPRARGRPRSRKERVALSRWYVHARV